MFRFEIILLHPYTCLYSSPIKHFLPPSSESWQNSGFFCNVLAKTIIENLSLLRSVGSSICKNNPERSPSWNLSAHCLFSLKVLRLSSNFRYFMKMSMRTLSSESLRIFFTSKLVFSGSLMEMLKLRRRSLNVSRSSSLVSCV